MIRLRSSLAALVRSVARLRPALVVLGLSIPALVSAQILQPRRPVSTSGAPAPAPTVDLDAPGAVRFEAIEQWRPMASLLTGPVKIIVGIPAQSSVRVAPTDEVIVPVSIDPTGSGTAIGAVSASVQWDPARLTLVRIDSGGVPGLNANTTQAADGSALLSIFSANGATQPATVANLVFRAAATYGGTTVRVTPTVISDPAGTSLLRATVVRYAAACVAATGKWGDVNGDDAVNIIDAQQISRASIGLTVLRSPLVLAHGDVNGADGVNIIDALQVARFAIGLTAPAPPARIGQSAFEPPAVAGISVSPATREIGLGEGVALIASPANLAGTAVDGCVPTTWTSSNPAIATVDAFGIVTAQAAGTAEISASTGTRIASATITVINRAVKVASLQLVEGPEIATYPAVQTGSPIRVRAVNEAGAPLSGVAVTIGVTDGTALVGPTTAFRNTGAGTSPITLVTDADGIVALRVWGGMEPLSSGTVTASTAGAPPQSMQVTAIPPRLGESICIADGWSRRCWGNGSRGQLGHGSFGSSVIPVNVAANAITFGPTSVMSRDSYGDHSCLTDAAGAAFCWGSNTAGQLGDGSFVNRSTPVRVVTNKSFIDIVTGSEHTCALTAAAAGGEIWCWGYNWSGQLGDGSVSKRTATPVRVVAPGGAAFTALTAGANFTCGRVGTGSWYCWGLNNSGQLGDGTTLSSPLPVAVSGTFEQVDAGEFHACGRTALTDQAGSGAVFCWGSGSSGALGNGAFTSSPVPVPVKDGTGFREIQSGYGRTCATKADLNVFCWGWNAEGQLGEGSITSRNEPTLMPFVGTHLVASGTNTWASGQTTCGVTPVGRQVFCWGSNASGKLGRGGPTAEPITNPALVARAGGLGGSAATLFPPEFGGGLPVAIASTTPVPDGLIVRVVDALGAPVANRPVTFRVTLGGPRFDAGATQVTTNTDASGFASTGNIVSGTTLGLSKIEIVTSVRSPGGADAIETYVLPILITNAPAAIEIVSGNDVWVGGINPFNLVPVRVRVKDVTGAPIPAARVSFTAGGVSRLTEDAGVQVATNDQGIATLDAQRWEITGAGLATLTARAERFSGTSELSTVTITRTRATQVQTGVFPGTACDLDQGTVYCWGSNQFGALGRGPGETAPNSPTAAAVTGLSGVTALAEGLSTHKCALVGTSAYCWGMNDAGQLGDGTYTNQSTPTPVQTTVPFKSLATGGHTTCGISTSDALYCWGWSGTAGFGLGADRIGTRVQLPTLIPDLPADGPFVKVTIAEDAVCGLTAAGKLYCRGSAAGGWNLDGTSDQRYVFTAAAGGPWKKANAAYVNLCAIGQDDKVRCAGGNADIAGLGRGLGAGIPWTANTLVGGEVVGGRSFGSVIATNYGGCAIELGTDDLYCWGNNLSGQSGSGTLDLVPVPTKVPGVRLASVRAQAFRTTCGVTVAVGTTPGTLLCWGLNGAGQVGLGSLSPSVLTSPAPVKLWPGTPAGVAIALEVNPSGAARTGIGFAGAPLPTAPSVKVVQKDGAAVSGVTVRFSVVRGGGSIATATALSGADGIAAGGAWQMGPEAGVENALLVEADGLPSIRFSYQTQSGVTPASIAAVGNTIQYSATFEPNSRHPLEVRVRDTAGKPLRHVPVTFRIPANASCLSSTPTPCRINEATQVTVTTDEKGIATPSWGGVVSWSTPTVVGTYQIEAMVSGLAPVTFTMLKREFYGGNNTCRLHEDGRAYCWGSSSAGALGTGFIEEQYEFPVQVADIPQFVSLAEGPASQHNCGITPVGEAWCWGDNQTGALGTGNLDPYYYPVKVVGDLTFKKLFKGMGSTCGITTSDAVYCWGWSSRSRFGDGEHGSVKPAPTLVNTNGLVFTQLALAFEGTCGRTAAGTVHCWSSAPSLLGEGGTVRLAPSPMPLPGITATQISVGDRGACAVGTDGGVRCWGENQQGQLGIGSTLSQSYPVTPKGLADGVKEVKHATWTSACALKLDGSVLCWGNGQFGQLGNGATLPTSTVNALPTPIVLTSAIEGIEVRATKFHPTGSDGAYCVEKSGDESFCWGRAWTSGSYLDSSRPTLLILGMSFPAVRSSIK